MKRKLTILQEVAQRMSQNPTADYQMIKRSVRAQRKKRKRMK